MFSALVLMISLEVPCQRSEFHFPQMAALIRGNQDLFYRPPCWYFDKHTMKEERLRKKDKIKDIKFPLFLALFVGHEKEKKKKIKAIRPKFPKTSSR
jgi:hypothetical protein